MSPAAADNHTDPAQVIPESFAGPAGPDAVCAPGDLRPDGTRQMNPWERFDGTYLWLTGTTGRRTPPPNDGLTGLPYLPSGICTGASSRHGMAGQQAGSRDLSAVRRLVPR